MSKTRRPPNIFPKPKMVNKPQSETNSSAKMTIAITKQVPIKRILPDDLPLLYSDGMLVQHKDGMFTLCFLLTRQPLAVTPEDVEEIKEVKAFCVAQILLTPEQMEKIISAMQENFQKFIDKINQIKEEK